jgi:predicted RND superfamily exporter protein
MNAKDPRGFFSTIDPVLISLGLIAVSGIVLVLIITLFCLVSISSSLVSSSTDILILHSFP